MQAIAVFAVVTLQFLTKIVESADAEMYAIPLSLNPIIQSPVELTETIKIFYNADPEFYSNVTLTDVSRDTQQDLKEIVRKKLSVIFYTAASSYIGETLKKSDLKYISGSNWSYSIPVDELIAGSEGSITKLNEEMELYIFQELGMKYLEKRYNFNMSDIQTELGLSLMEFFGASEEQWIKIVGFITEEMINRRSKELGLTPCYLAELLNKTEKEIGEFTLNQVDEYIYNITSLQKKVPQFKETILTKTFNVTFADLAKLGGLNVTEINYMALQDQVKLFTTSIFQRFDLSVDEIVTKYKKSSNDILTPCPEQWESVQALLVQEAFEKEATKMSLANNTLATLIEIPYPKISKISWDEMEHLIETKIREVKENKNIIEQKKLGQVGGTITSEANIFSIIERVTNFSKSELSLIYGWEDTHYRFAQLFSVADLIHSCTSEVHNYTLLELAVINAGEDSELCMTLSALQNIWRKATVNELEQKFGNQFSNSTIENMLLTLTGANLTFIYRVLSWSADARLLCANVTLNHISTVTSQTTMHLKQMSFQNIIDLAEELKANGTLFQSTKMTTAVHPMTSRIVPSMHTSFQKTASTKTNSLIATMNKTPTAALQNPSTKDNNEATRMVTSRVEIGSMNATIRHNLTNNNKATRIVNTTVAIGSVNVTIPYNSSNMTMTTSVDMTMTTSVDMTMTTSVSHVTFAPVSSAYSLFTDGLILTLIVFSSRYLAFV